jgi:acyl-CoA synthetase (AMP-forming)/AMP-acid ligase II
VTRRSTPIGEEQSALDADGWFDTGDLAVIDEAGHVSITGRTKDLIKSGGEWINPGEIEAIVGSSHARKPISTHGRPGGDTDLMGPALLLASDAGGHITGQTLVIDGGATII